MPISPALLRHMARHVDQSTRVACCLSSKYMHNALTQAGAWRRVTVHKPTDAALRFIERVEVKVVHLDFSQEDMGRLEEFLAALPTNIEALYMTLDDIAFVHTIGIMERVSELRSLRHLTIDCRHVSRPTCMCIPSLPELYFLRITEHGSPAKLEVYFDDAMLPCMEEVHLEVCTSDILAQAKRYRSLRRIVYMAGKETFEDAHLEDKRLDSLMVRVASPDGMSFLATELARARHVERLTLTCAYEDVRVEMYLPARHVLMKLENAAHQVSFLFPVVRELESLSVQPSTLHSRPPWTVRFYFVGSWHNFQKWLDQSTLEVGFEGTVVVDPM